MGTFISENIGLRENGYIYKQKHRTERKWVHL